MESLAESDISFGADVFNVVTPGDIGVSVMEMEVSLAVAASSSVPLVLGPVVMRDNRKSAPGKDIYVHVSDGGVNDNQGLVTLIELLYRLDGAPNAKEGNSRGRSSSSSTPTPVSTRATARNRCGRFRPSR